MILAMQIGLALIESGSVRDKNSTSVLVKAVLELFTGALVFYLSGYGFLTDQ